MSADPGVVEDRGGGPSMGMAGGGATVGGGGAAEGVAAAVAAAPPWPAELVAMTHCSPPRRGEGGWPRC